MSAEPDPSVSCEDGDMQTPPPETAALFLSAFDSSGDLVVLRGFGGKVAHVNQAFLTAFGGEREDWIGRWFSVAPPRGQMRRRREIVRHGRSPSRSRRRRNTSNG